MKLTEWARRRRRGVFAELNYQSRVSLKTVYKAAQLGEPVSAEVAEKLSAAVDAIEARSDRKVGRVSVEEIRFPRGRPAAQQQAEPHGRRRSASSAA